MHRRDRVQGRPGRGARRAIVAAALALSVAVPALGQEFDGPYPVRLLTIETAALHARGRGVIGVGDARISLLTGRLEIVTNTIGDAVSLLNAGVKIGVAAGRGDRPAVAVGGRYYHSVDGLIDSGVRRIAESFADVTDPDVDVRGWVGYLTASWPLTEGIAHAHASLQMHRPLESRFAVEDSVAGGGGSVRFQEGEDVSAMVGLDHRLVDRRLLLLAEAGWSWGLDKPRLGLGLDAGSENWRVAVGALYPGVETDLATEPRDFYVTPTFSLHHRF